MLWQRCSDVLTMSDSDFVTTSKTDVGTTFIFERATKLWQYQLWRCDNIVTTSLCQLGRIKYFSSFIKPSSLFDTTII